MKTRMNDLIKVWYLSAFPNDTLANQLNPRITFKGLQEILYTHVDIYDYLFLDGSVCSIIRENLFNELADILHVEYEVIYKLWMDKPKRTKSIDWNFTGKLN